MKKNLFNGRFLALNSTNGYEYVERQKGKDAVAILAITPNNEVVLIRQFRPTLENELIELPAGLIGDSEDESIFDAGKRELLEETGYKSETWTLLGCGPSSSGLTTEYIYFLYAKNAYKVSDGGGVDDEKIEVLLTPIDKLKELYKSEIYEWDYKIDAALYKLSLI